MNAFGSMLYDSSVMRAYTPARYAVDVLPESARAVCCRVDGLPAEINSFADSILTAAERDYWQSMRGVDKRRHEWLLGRAAAKDAVRLLLEQYADLWLSPDQIEILPDAYGCPRVSGTGIRAGLQPVVSIAHSHGVAVGLAVLDPGALAGVDLEGTFRHRENYESIAFHPDERRILADIAPDLAEEWALRMWCAKEAVGKALGRGLSHGLLALRITHMDIAGGLLGVELRDAALDQFPELRGKLLTVYTVRESDFVFSAIIYQQGAVRMRPSRQEILDYLLQKMGELTQDWDYTEPVRPGSLLFSELGFESLDAVVLCTAIQEHYQTPMPFAELLAEIGQQQRDLSIDELTTFVDTHLNGPAGSDHATRRLQ